MKLWYCNAIIRNSSFLVKLTKVICTSRKEHVLPILRSKCSPYYDDPSLERIHSSILYKGYPFVRVTRQNNTCQPTWLLIQSQEPRQISKVVDG
jgi:hypothetical protein